jgi:hypothetical protein
MTFYAEEAARQATGHPPRPFCREQMYPPRGPGSAHCASGGQPDGGPGPEGPGRQQRLQLQQRLQPELWVLQRGRRRELGHGLRRGDLLRSARQHPLVSSPEYLKYKIF